MIEAALRWEVPTAIAACAHRYEGNLRFEFIAIIGACTVRAPMVIHAQYVNIICVDGVRERCFHIAIRTVSPKISRHNEIKPIVGDEDAHAI
jgi:hypothetical protein